MENDGLDFEVEEGGGVEGGGAGEDDGGEGVVRKYLLFAELIEGGAAELDEAGDPDEVARAVQECIRAAEPPARLLIGADAVEMEKTARGSSPEELAALLRKSVADLT